MTQFKVMLVNQSFEEVSAFDAEKIPYVSVYLDHPQNGAMVDKFDGPHSYTLQNLCEIVQIAEGEKCTYLASYLDGSAPVCNIVQNLLGIESNCADEYFSFFHDKFFTNKTLELLGHNRRFGEFLPHDLPAFPGAGKYILKPRNMQGSIGVWSFSANDSDEWSKSCIRYIEDFGPDFEKATFLWEQFADGPEYSVDVYVRDSSIHWLGCAKKSTSFTGNFVESSHLVGDVINTEQKQKLLSELNRVFKFVGYASGPAHVEFKWDNENLHFIEFHPRPGGDCLIELIYEATGNSLVEHLTSHLQKTRPPEEETQSFFSFIQYFSSPLSSEQSLSIAQSSVSSKVKIRNLFPSATKIKSSRDRAAYVRGGPLKGEALLKFFFDTNASFDWEQKDTLQKLLSRGYR